MEPHTLIIDIETVGESWDALDSTSQHVLTRWIDRTIHDPEAHAHALEDIRNGLGFSPWTGRVVAIGLYDLERDRGVVYYEDVESDEYEVGRFVMKPRTEREMLEDFWEGAKEYHTFVTFNGRGFDVPFLNIRSAAHGIRPAHDLMEGRYLYQQKSVHHIDLQDQLTYYGAMYRRPSLHLVCRSFGIESPKCSGVQGDDVARLVAEGRFREIAEYNAHDVAATTELYRRWCAYLAPSLMRGDTIDDMS